MIVRNFEPVTDGPPRTDASLASALRAGDEGAAAELVRRHGAALARYLQSGGANSSEVEDLVQEAFFRAFRSLDRWRQEASFRSWLFRIGGNLRKDQYRRDGGRVFLTIDDHDLPDAADPAAVVDAKEMGRLLARELGRLPRLQREVFLLRAEHGMGYEEIAATLGTTPGAARVHYHHAVRRLKESVT